MDRFERLKQDGIANGMCQKFQDEWQDPTVAELSRFFFRGLDFCIEHNWPSIELINETFDLSELAEYGIFVKSGVARNKLNVCVLGDSEVHVYVPDLAICDIYARHNSKVHIHLGYKSFCYLSAYDNTSVFIDEKEEGARIKASYCGGVLADKEKFDVINDKTKEK